ncbi:hypothetical protein NLJ89_g10398 [Agrocybe chaxingu]|uniref:Uncharacterized protein n=1 Tax=Agrocybe chaxingu TaxID=84603 RepID=A0A9W8JUA3_9AGAR|nr:hypothetical protein NLJ89_g10398 [Agrocybe chaxingu]
MFGLRSVFRFSKKEKKSTEAIAPLPPDWPSSLHSKCSVPTCLFPNPPQAAEGRYNCQGGFRGFECQGTYYVSASRAHAMVKKHVFQTRRATDVKLKAQKALEAHRQQLIKAQKAMAEAKALAATTYDLEVTCEPPKQSRHTKDLPPIPGLSQRRKQLRLATGHFTRTPYDSTPSVITIPSGHGQRILRSCLHRLLTGEHTVVPALHGNHPTPARTTPGSMDLPIRPPSSDPFACLTPPSSAPSFLIWH